MAKPIPIRGKDGKFNGSIGVGRDNVPSASEVEIPSLTVVRETDPDFSSYTSVREVAAKLLREFEPDAQNVLANPQAAVDYAFAMDAHSRRLNRENMTALNNGEPALASGWSYGASYGSDGSTPLTASTLADDYSLKFRSSADAATTIVEMRTSDDVPVTMHVDKDRLLHSPSKYEAAVVVTGVGSVFYRHGVVHRSLSEGSAVDLEDGTSSWVEDGKVYVTVNPDGSVVDGEGEPVKGFALRWKKLTAVGLSAAIDRRKNPN